MNELIPGIHIFEQAVINRIPNPNPYIPNGRDNLERDLQQELYDSLEMTFILQFPLLFSFLIKELLSSAPYFKTNLTVMDWFCTILAHISFIFFIKTIYNLKFIGRQKAYFVHFPNSFILIFLEFSVASDIIYFCFTEESLRGSHTSKRDKNYMEFVIAFFITLNLVLMFYRNIQIYFRLRNHKQILNTIPKLPYKPNGA